MSAKSFVTTSTNGDILNKLSASSGDEQVKLEITKLPTLRLLWWKLRCLTLDSCLHPLIRCARLLKMNKDLVNILSQASEKKIYGSVEVFFENGTITQVTQRIISKMPKTGPAGKKLVKLKNNHKNIIKPGSSDSHIASEYSKSYSKAD
jgi:hypothetical protein